MADTNENSANDKNGENNNELAEDPEQPLKYPKQVFFIISNEFCERFCYYGNRTILSIYLKYKLNFSEDDATIIYHSFVMLCYFFPLVGGIIADSYLGKFRVILYLSILYAFGNITLAAASSMQLPIDAIASSLLGLFLIAIGTGGIKPCVSSFGGDQFAVPQQAKQLVFFFSVFYFSINAGSSISTILTPELRDMSCLGSNSCYPLAFGIPAALMVTAVVFFVCGTPLYIMKTPTGNIMLQVSKCVGTALMQKISSGDKKEHWLDHAADKYSPELVADTKVLIELIYLFAPTVLFWGLYDIQGSRWIFQAMHMDGKTWIHTIKPDQMLSINPVLIMILIPIFDLIIYPLLYKLRLVRTSLEKLFWGGIVAALAFVISAYVEYKTQDYRALLPQLGEAQLRIYNNYNCSLCVNATVNDKAWAWTINRMGLLEEKYLPVTGEANLKFSAAFEGTECPSLLPITDRTLPIFETRAVSFITTESQNALDIVWLNETFDDLTKSDNTYPKISIVHSVVNDTDFSLYNKDMSTKVDGTLYANTHVTETYLVEPTGDYTFQINNEVIISDLPLDSGGVYTLLLEASGDKAVLFTLTPANIVHILWQFPQIFVLTVGEILFSITGLQFSYSQAPQSLKSVISSLWLLTNSFGNLVIIILSALTKDVPEVTMYLLFSSMMVFVMLVFGLLAKRFAGKMTAIGRLSQ